MINLELPKKLKASANQAHQVAAQIFRPISRKYDLAEHEYPVELDTMAAMVEGLSDSGGDIGGASGGRSDASAKGGNANGGNMSALLNSLETSWGDVGLMLSIPYQGLGNAAIAAVSTDEQLERFGKVWASMAITEPSFGSDSAAVTTTAVLDGDEWVLNGEKIFVTAGERSTHIVVWASVDKSKGRAAIKSFVVPRDAPGLSVARLEHKLGIKASDTAVLLPPGLPHSRGQHPRQPGGQRGAGALPASWQTFDNTRPLVAAMAVRRRTRSSRRTAWHPDRSRCRDLLRHTGLQPACSCSRVQSVWKPDWEAAYLLSLRAAWMADNKKPNSLEASMSKAKAGRTGTDVTLKAVELAGTYGYSQRPLLEKWGRDSKILDIFEGTQQIQQLIVARPPARKVVPPN